MASLLAGGGAHLANFRPDRSGSVHLHGVEPLSAMVFPFSTGPSRPGCSCTDMAEAPPVHLSPGSCAPRGPSQSLPQIGPISSSGSSLMLSSLVWGPSLPPRWHSLGDSHQERSGAGGNPTPSPQDVEALGLASSMMKHLIPFSSF